MILAADYLKENKTKVKNVGGKNEKIISMSSKIAEHDLKAKINHILKWIAKERCVRVIIAGASQNLAGAVS